MSIASFPVSENLSGRLREQRARLHNLRDQARERYSGGAPGLQVATLICEWTDRLIVEIFEEALAPLGEADRRRVTEQSAIVAIGGTGRGELAPYSDADLLFLRTKHCPGEYDECIARTVRDCWDAGIRLGHSVRTPAEALASARGDPSFATALVESRRLWGDERLFESFCEKFQRKVVRNRYVKFYHDCLAAREAERAQYGVTERQLEPDVKRSLGGLRDIHLLRWIGSAAWGTPDIDQLRRQGALSLSDSQALTQAQEFLTRIRVDLHFAAGKPQETLTREEQLRLAKLHGAAGTAGQLPVEQFMQTYFRHSTAVADISARFVARHRPRSLWSRTVQALFSHRSNEIFRVGGGEIDVVPRHREQACSSLEGLLRLYELAGAYSARPSPELSEQIRQAAAQLSREVSPQAARMFLSILRATGAVGQQLRGMFATGVLEIVVPEMSHARCLLQFNQYHAYTVDEHSLRAVESAEAFDGDAGPIGTAYRKIKHKELLHLALLLHDLGKGFERDHSEIGRELAATVAQRLFLSPQQRETLVFLVHKHLLMSHLALRRDLSDPEMLARFSRDVGSPELLRMLYVMTASDVSAVGPSAWTSWKSELVTELFERALQILSGEPSQFREAERVGDVCRGVQAALEAKAARGNGRLAGKRTPSSLPDDVLDVERRLRAFPAHYLIATPPEEIVDDLVVTRHIADGALDVAVRGTYDPPSQTVEYRIVTRDQVGSGLFSKVTGVLTAKGSQILSADICTTNDGIVIDRFRVVDGDHAPPVPEFRLHEVEAAIAETLQGRKAVEDLFQRHRRYVVGADAVLPFGEPTRVVIDNDSSERFTIIDVFAHDRRGLLYTIAATLLALDLSVSLAKISTHVDQVLDVFYVTDREGGKLQDEDRLARIRTTLVERIESFARSGPELQSMT
jgi:[protein-PII] uridylyltransferase